MNILTTLFSIDHTEMDNLDMHTEIFHDFGKIGPLANGRQANNANALLVGAVIFATALF